MIDLKLADIKPFLVFDLQNYDEYKNPWEEYTCEHADEIRKILGETVCYISGFQPASSENPDPEEEKRWTDDIGKPLKVNYNDLEHIQSIGTDLYATEIMVEEQVFKLLIENDCGFAVGYANPELYELVNQ